MIRLLFILSVIITPVEIYAASQSVPLKTVLVDLNNKSSLQRGAQIYMNNCLGCHTLKYQRYVKFIDHLKDVILNVLIIHFL